MGIGALLTLLFVLCVFTTMFWLIARMPGPSSSTHEPTKASGRDAGPA